MTKFVFDKCDKNNSENCNKCDIGYILKKYIKPLMQTLTNDIREYYMQLLTTKCLNTAIMLSIFMLGKRKGINIANYCDTERTRERHLKYKDNNNSIISTFTKDILNTRKKYRELYYILLTDGKFENKDINKPPLFFPGHVFILEKIPSQSILQEQYYYFYQSYINNYDLKDHIKKNNNTLKLSYTKTQELLNNLNYILNCDIWDKKCIDIWKSFTFADTTHLKDSFSKNNLFLCIKKARVIDCLKHIQKYTLEKLNEIDKSPISKINNIYGDNSLYDLRQTPLTIKQMKVQLQHLYKDISIKKIDLKL